MWTGEVHESYIKKAEKDPVYKDPSEFTGHNWLAIGKSLSFGIDEANLRAWYSKAVILDPTHYQFQGRRDLEWSLEECYHVEKFLQMDIHKTMNANGLASLEQVKRQRDLALESSSH